MPIDIARKIVFIHIPKTGGTSIEGMLQMLGREHLHSHSPLQCFVPANKTPQHMTWLELKKNIGVALSNGFARKYSITLDKSNWARTLHSTSLFLFDLMGKAFLKKAYKFAFVRNPWDRFLSEFCWRKAWYFKALQKGAELFYSPTEMVNLDTFVKVLELPKEKRIDAKRGFDGHLETQTSFIVGENRKIAMDFVGRFENFEEDLSIVADRLGIELGRIMHLTKSRREKDYRQYYSAYSRSAVQSFYKDDIKEFGYKF